MATLTPPVIPNAGIAANLWAKGDKTEAREVFEKALVQAPNLSKAEGINALSVPPQIKAALLALLESR